MRVALFLMVVVGVGMGGMMPVRTPPAPPAAEAHAAEARPAMVETARDVPVETVLQRKDGHFFTLAQVNGQPVNFLIDTGSSTVALTVEDAQRIGLPFSESEFEVIGTGASGPVRGKRVKLGSVILDGKRRSDIDGSVVEGLDISLLGQSYLTRMGTVEMSGDRMRIR